MFKEYITYYEGWGHPVEVHIHLNEKGKIIRTYCWSDDIPEKETYSEAKRDYVSSSPKITPCRNELFVDISKQWIINNLQSIYFNEEDYDEYFELASQNYKNLQL